MLNRYSAKGRKVIYRHGEGDEPQVVASSPTKVQEIFIEQILEHLSWLEGERERMAVIVRRQAQEVAQLEERVSKVEKDIESI